MLARSLTRGALEVAHVLGGPLLGRRPVNDRGVALDARLHFLVTLIERGARPGLDALGPDRARVEFNAQTRIGELPRESLHRVEDRWIPGPAGELRIRVYTPRGGPDALPAVVYYHGGGFVVGDLESHDASCRHLARHACATVIAIDYRLAPEDPFPAGVEDACAAFRWVHANAGELHVDPRRIAVAGDSAGGNLAAVVAQQMRNEDHPLPCWQLLIYPATDMTRSCESHEHFREGAFLRGTTIDWFLANYLTDPAQELDPRASPLATRDLGGLPPAHVAVAGFDPLRDEGEAYAHALMAADVSTTLRCYGSLVHGFFGMGAIVPAARWATEDLVAEARRALWR